MRKITMAVALAAALLASGCATYQAGSASQSDLLKRFEPIPGKGSVYVCRIPALLVARGVKTEVLIDNENIGTLKANSFVHTTVEPGNTACCCATTASTVAPAGSTPSRSAPGRSSSSGSALPGKAGEY